MTLPHSGTLIGGFGSVGIDGDGGGQGDPGTVDSVTGPSSVNEGSSATFNVTTSSIASGGTLNWSVYLVSATASNADFGSTSGTTTVDGSGNASFSVPITADNTTEGSETFRVLVSHSPSGTSSLSGFVTINDTSQTPATPTINTVSGPASVNEGSSASISVSTANIPNGTVLNWAINNVSTTNADFGSTSGTVTINSNSGSFSIPITADATLEGSETFTVTVSGTVSSTAVSETSGSITINDTSVPAATPTVDSVSVSASTVAEGNSITVTVDVSDYSDGNKLFNWVINAGSGITSGDLSPGLSGNVLINSSGGFGTANFTLTAVADGVASEGNEVFSITVNDPTSAASATSINVTITDTTPTYSVNAPTNINEGDSATCTVSTTNVSNGTTLYWTVSPSGDFGTSSGSFSISSNAGSFNISPTADLTTEGNETGTISIRTGSTSGTVVATDTFTIVDTSVDQPTYTFGGDTTIVEGDNFSFSATRTGGTGSTTIYYAITTTAGGTFNRVVSGDRTGSVTFSGAGTQNATGSTVLLDTIQGNVGGVIRWYSDSGRTQELPNSPHSWTMVDADPAVTSVSGPSSIDEGTNGTISVTTSNVPDGTSLNWNVNHTSTSNVDFVTDSDTVTINNNAGSFTLSPVADATTEGNETCTITVSGTVSSTAVSGTSGTITINDTSAQAAGMDSSFTAISGFQSVSFSTFPEAYFNAQFTHEPSNNRIKIAYHRGSSTQSAIIVNHYVNYTGLSNITSVEASYTTSGQSCTGSCMTGAFGPLPTDDGYSSGTYYSVPTSGARQFGWMAKVNTNFASSSSQVVANAVVYRVKVVDSVEGTFTAVSNSTTVQLAANDGSTPEV